MSKFSFTMHIFMFLLTCGFVALVMLGLNLITTFKLLPDGNLNIYLFGLLSNIITFIMFMRMGIKPQCDKIIVNVVLGAIIVIFSILITLMVLLSVLLSNNVSTFIKLSPMLFNWLCSSYYAYLYGDN